MDYRGKFIAFLKKYNLYDDKIFHYLMDNAFFVDFDRCMDFVGCCFSKNEYNTVTKVRLCLPKLVNDNAVMIAIHEYVHGILMYNRIGKRHSEKATEEVLPMLYEYIYYLENVSKDTVLYSRDLNNLRKNSRQFKYMLGAAMREILYDNKDKDIKELNDMVRSKSHTYIKFLKTYIY